MSHLGLKLRPPPWGDIEPTLTTQSARPFPNNCWSIPRSSKKPHCSFSSIVNGVSMATEIFLSLMTPSMSNVAGLISWICSWAWVCVYISQEGKYSIYFHNKSNWRSKCIKYWCLWCGLSIIRLNMKYIFIINLIEDLNVDNIFYKLSEIQNSLTFVKRDLHSFWVIIFLQREKDNRVGFAGVPT